MHVDILGLLSLREMLVENFHVDEGPGEIISVADSLDPGCFWQETCSTAQVAHDLSDSRQLVHIVDFVGGLGQAESLLKSSTYSSIFADKRTAYMKLSDSKPEGPSKRSVCSLVLVIFS